MRNSERDIAVTMTINGDYTQRQKITGVRVIHFPDHSDNGYKMGKMYIRRSSLRINGSQLRVKGVIGFDFSQNITNFTLDGDQTIYGFKGRNRAFIEGGSDMKIGGSFSKTIYGEYITFK